MAFVRDRDGHLDRQEAIEAAIDRASKEFDDAPAVIGGVAIERLESWVAALAGATKTEQLGQQKIDGFLAGRGIAAKASSAMAKLTREADLEAIPSDAESLRHWLNRAADILRSTTTRPG